MYKQVKKTLYRVNTAIIASALCTFDAHMKANVYKVPETKPWFLADGNTPVLRCVLLLDSAQKCGSNLPAWGCPRRGFFNDPCHLTPGPERHRSP